MLESRCILESKNSSKNYDFTCSIAYKTHPYTGGSKKCELCLNEKLAILKADSESVINTRDELVSKCRNMIKFALTFTKKKKLTKYFF